MNKILHVKEYIDQLILENDDILLPRRSKEERDKNYIRIVNKQLEQYIKDGMHGNLDFYKSVLINFNSTELRRIGNSLILSASKNLKEFNPINLEIVYGSLLLNRCDNLAKIDIPNVSKIGGNFFTYECKNLTEINAPNIESVGESLYLNECPKLVSLNLSNLSIIYNDLSLSDCVLIDFNMPKLKRIGRHFYLYNTRIAKKCENNPHYIREYLLENYDLTVNGEIKV